MDFRRSKRVITDFPAEVIWQDRRYAGTVGNLSVEGAYVVTTPGHAGDAFNENTLIELKFQVPAGDKVHLHGRVKWSFLTPPHGYTLSLGIDLIDPPRTYLEALKTLQ